MYHSSPPQINPRDVVDHFTYYFYLQADFQVYFQDSVESLNFKHVVQLTSSCAADKVRCTNFRVARACYYCFLKVVASERPRRQDNFRVLILLPKFSRI